MKTKLSAIAAGMVLGLVGQSAHALTENQKNVINESLATTQAQLSQRIQQYKQEQTPLSEMKADLIVDFKRTGLNDDQAAQLADRFESEDQVISSLEVAAEKTATAGPLLFANMRYLMNETSTFAANHPIMAMFPYTTMTLAFFADLLMSPVTFSADASNYVFGGEGRRTLMGLFTGALADDKGNGKAMTDQQNCKAAWISLLTVPLDALLTPFYVVGTVVMTVEQGLANRR